MPINTEKILKELSKGTVDEQIEAFKAIKEAITKSVQEEQQQLEQKANNLQTTLDRLNNQQ